MKRMDFGNGIFAVIPPQWEMNDEYAISLYDPKSGVGAMQLSFYDTKVNTPIDITAELQSFLEERHKEVTIEDKREYAYSEIEKDGIFWRYWLLAINGKVIFISYNSENLFKGKEDSIVDAIIKTISPN